MLKTILNLRLSYVYPILFGVFLLLLSVVEPQKLTPGQLALYSVNSFLFGFYFSPLLSAQKARVDGLNKAVRQEVMVILDILAQSHLLTEKVRHQLKIRLRAYLDSINGNTKIAADNPQYDELLRFTKQDKFKDDSVMDVIYGRISKTQENRDNIESLLGSKVYSHEWLVTLVLFVITIYFVMQTDYNHLLFFKILLAILCTGISLMLVILVKYATLAHKQAKKMWQPMQELLKDHFEDIDRSEVIEQTKNLEVETA
ncbi:MAG TPA: hypothetical protein VLF21_02545 [Candidatus Saccharimonadales bacterium]|nr:hypothetical protein [Candidatus Saccharimonadales bacterium]